ncbi:MAG TPA: M14 family zinc carboxypeptidase [Pyrinomonadaceae bacterium]|nr:M14 family zinc carboxypeptidase [Pyrinomonadaceae bacterium]
MTRGRSLSLRPAFSFACAVLALLCVSHGAHAQRRAATTAPAASTSTAAAATRNDEAYTAKIREYTTEKYFLTELVDHLPASDRVPTPEKVLGYVVGTPNRLTYTKDIHRYMRELERTSPRVRVFVAPEKSEEGREQLLVAISDEANLARLDRYKEITARLADPRRTTETEAKQLIGEGKAFYWASGAIHSTETGSPEMLMEMAYRLAVEESPFIQDIRRNLVVLITPTLEVDGRDRMVDLYNYRKANPGKNSPSLLYWGKYVAHDNNRDGLGMALALTRNMMRTFLEYHPQVLHDLHESVPFLYTSTGTGPYNAWLDPIVIDEWHLLAYHEVEEMTKRGVPGVWTHGFYDGWAPNYMFYVANGHNSIGRFYETFGNGGADTLDRTVQQQAQRDWYRPNPPHSRVKWSLRNNVNLQQSALLLAMNFTANNRERFLNNFYLKSKRAVAKASNEGPAAYIVPGDAPRPVEAADMVNLLRLMGVEVHRATREFTVRDERPQPRQGADAQRGDAPRAVEQGAEQRGAEGERAPGSAEQQTSRQGAGQTQGAAQAERRAAERRFPAGSYIIRMDQPYSRMADMMLDTQYYNASDPRPYDDTGWTLGAMRNVPTVRVKDRAVLAAPMELLTADATVRGRLTGASGAKVFVINHNTENTLATLRYRLRDVRMSVAENAFKVGAQDFNAGSFIIRTEGNPADLRARLEAAVTELGLTAAGFGDYPAVRSHEIGVPRIAILHTWQNTQNEGWYRIEFDRLRIPYSYISEHTIRDTPNLRERYDVIIFPPVGGTAQSIVNGIPRRGDPIPWKASAVTPNFGNSPDQTDDIRGGMGLTGVANLQRFVSDGGLFVAVQNTVRVPVEYGMTTGVTIEQPRQLQAAGSIYNATFTDRKSPISYGYGEQLPIYFNQAPLFQVATGVPGAGGGGAGGGAGSSGGRPSGRGSLNDPDIIQGMPQAAPPPQRPPAAPGEEQITEEQRLQLGVFYVPVRERPRVVMRFAREERDLLVSGMLAGGAELANRAAVIDVPYGRGHILLFATNPMWRHQTQGEFFLLFNAALNYDHLGVGLAEPTTPTAPPRETRSEQ